MVERLVIGVDSYGVKDMKRWLRIEVMVKEGLIKLRG